MQEMRWVHWTTPFSDFDPFAISVANVMVGDPGWKVEIAECAPSAKPRRWLLSFHGVAGVKVSNESFRDWVAWHHAFPGSEALAAFKVDGALWRNEYWNAQQSNPSMSHFAIKTANMLVEFLAEDCEILETERA